MTSTPHFHPWHRDSLFGDGPRRSLNRDQRARFRFLLNAHRRVHHLTPLAELVGTALLRRLGEDGRCDPEHKTLADDAGCCVRTVGRALEKMKDLGLLLWQRRIVREGWRTSQTSNAYLLALPENQPEIRPRPSGGQNGRGIRRKNLILKKEAMNVELADAQAALARRRLAIQLRLGRR